jgi:surface carbohydrate biosynthesis protein
MRFGLHSEKHRRLLIPVETLHRELDAKLLLACFAAERGFSVILGFKRDIHHSLERLPSSLYLGKALYASTLKLYRRLHRLGYSILSTDEEGLVYYSPETYRQAKLGPETLNEVDVLFAWGEENAELWRGYSGYRGTPIHVTGNPRVDMLRPELRGYWAQDVEALHRRFGKFILINSNFGKVNHFREDRASQLQILEQAARSATGSVDPDGLALASHRLELFNEFKTMAASVAAAYPDRTIVIRPHPSERKETWREATAGCPNVQVLYEGNVIPWLLGSEVVVHNGCTTGLEAYLLEKPVISYQPVSSEQFDLYLPNGISTPAEDIDALKAQIDAALAGNWQPDAETLSRQRALVDRHIASLDGPLASERIVDVLAQFESPPGGYLDPPLLEHFKMCVQGALKRTRIRMKPWTKGPAKRHRYRLYDHKFAAFPVSDLESRIEKFSDLLGRFPRVRVRKLRAKIFSIENAAG